MKSFIKERGWFALLVIGIYLFSVCIFFTLYTIGPIPKETSINTNLAWLWLSFVLFYTFLSFKPIDAKKIASKTFFGRTIQNITSGLSFVPFGICKIHTFPRKLLTQQIGSPQKIDKYDENGALVGTVLAEDRSGLDKISRDPFRVTFSGRKTALFLKHWWHEEQEWLDTGGVPEIVDETIFEDDILSDRTTPDPVLTLQWVINDPSKFLTGIGDEDAAFANLEQVARAAIMEYCSKRTVAFVLRHLEDLHDYLLHAIEILVGDIGAKKRAEERHLHSTVTEWKEGESWGVDIRLVRLDNMGLSRQINQAITFTIKSGYEAKSVVTTAQGEKRRLELVAQGNLASERDPVKGRAEGLAELAKIGNGVDARMALEAETARAVAEQVGHLFVTSGDGSLASILGAIAAGKSTLGSSSSTTPRGSGTSTP